eukprot:3974042-Prymnesium_polylepis.1
MARQRNEHRAAMRGDARPARHSRARAAARLSPARPAAPARPCAAAPRTFHLRPWRPHGGLRGCVCVSLSPRRLARASRVPLLLDCGLRGCVCVCVCVPSPGARPTRAVAA